MSSSFGTLFRITTFGESHGPGIGVIVDGCPGGMKLDLEAIAQELRRRRPGQSSISTPRNEADEFEVLSGIYEEKTLGTPITFLVRNSDVKSGDYKRWADIYRPSHADFTYHAKYSHRTPLGGGRASARETIGRVIGGAIAGQILRESFRIETVSWVDSVGTLNANLMENPPRSRKSVEINDVRCPDPAIAKEMISYIEKLKEAGDSTGGTVGVVIYNVPAGLGDPVFERLEAEFARAALSIPACKGFESGTGFSGSQMTGSEHNDAFLAGTVPESKSENPFQRVPYPTTQSNRSGGIQGGISNGMPITMRLAFKPTATIRKNQMSVNIAGEQVELESGGRHDPCVVPRAIPIVEAMMNLVLVDALFKQRAYHPLWEAGALERLYNK